MVARDAAQTRARILDAAVAEFAAHGLAGGRVERIARAAGTNVRMIYAYFGHKEGLFDAALSSTLSALADELPPRSDDLSAWAGDLFDRHGADPAALRLALWARLERPDTAGEPDSGYASKVDALASAWHVERAEARDALVLAYAIAQAWYLSPRGLRAAGGADDDASAHRAAVVAAVRALRPRDTGA